jgi:hypothetical protein
MKYNVSTNFILALLVLAVWDLVWKAMAIWRAARRNETVWFVVLIIVNTAGLLPIYYLLSHKDIKPKHQED